MNIKIQSSFLPHADADASLAFYRDVMGFEVRGDVGYGGMRWITVGPIGQPDTSIVLQPPRVSTTARPAACSKLWRKERLAEFMSETWTWKLITAEGAQA